MSWCQGLLLPNQYRDNQLPVNNNTLSCSPSPSHQGGFPQDLKILLPTWWKTSAMRHLPSLYIIIICPTSAPRSKIHPAFSLNLTTRLITVPMAISCSSNINKLWWFLNRASSISIEKDDPSLSDLLSNSPSADWKGWESRKINRKL
jgi:hypothetical protein